MPRKPTGRPHGAIPFWSSDGEITAEELRSVLDYSPDTGVFTWKARVCQVTKIGDTAGTTRSNGYVRIKLKSRNYQAHRLAWLYVHGEWPPELIDHINGDRTDNRLANLRSVDNAANKQNVKAARADNKSTGLLGVTKSGAKYMAAITARGVSHSLGTFATAMEAHRAYLAAKKELHIGGQWDDQQHSA